MPLPVELQAVVDEMDAPSDEITGYINRKTGELFSVSEDDISAAEIGAEDGFVPDWQAESAAKAKEVEESDDWAALPDRFEIHEYSIMERYCHRVADESIGEALADAISGRGAFRRFKNVIHREGIADDWYDFRDQALRRIAADFLEVEGIPYAGGGPSR